MTDVTLCLSGEIREGEARAFQPIEGSRRKMFVVRKTGKIHAWWDRCPHAGAPMAWKTNAYLNAEGDRLVCFAHGAEFAIDTGVCLRGAALGQRLTAAVVEETTDGRIVFKYMDEVCGNENAR